MDSTKVRLTFMDGTQFEAEGLYAAVADRVKLEQRFGVGFGSIGTEDSREEWIIFLVWLMAERTGRLNGHSTFEAFVGDLARYEFDKGESLDPTTKEVHTG